MLRVFPVQLLLFLSFINYFFIPIAAIFHHILGSWLGLFSALHSMEDMDVSNASHSLMCVSILFILNRRKF